MSALRGLSRRTAMLVASACATRAAPRSSDVLLVVVRATLAWIFVYYGAGKLFGTFHGPGLHRTALYFASSAHLQPGLLFAVLGGVIEFAGAVALVLGLASRLAALALVGDMVMAVVTVTGANGINSESVTPGYELNLALGVLALVIVVLGAGRYSLDALITGPRRARRGP